MRPAHRPLRKALLSVAVAGLLFEGLVRGVLFGDWLAGVEALQPLREPGSYAATWEDTYWQLRHVRGRAPHIEPERVDRRLGWVPHGVQPGQYDHEGRGRLDGRRPVLLFGDSYAAGLTPQRFLFQSLLDRSDLGGELRMVNYGCPGYGADQALLLMRAALGHWEELDPIVLFGILVDDDYDRARLELRTLPKPRFRIDGDRLVLERDEVPTLQSYLAEAFPWWRPWSWRLVVHHLLPERASAWLRGEARREEATRRTALLLLETVAGELEARGIPCGFVLFHSQSALARPESLGWRERLTVETLERRGVPFVRSREALAAAMEAGGHPSGRFFYQGGMQANHLNRKGNSAVFEGMLPLIRTLHEASPVPLR